MGGYGDRFYGVIVIASSMSFIIWLYCFCKKISFRSNFFAYLGNISYEVYLIQGIVFIILNKVFNQGWYIPFLLIAVIILGASLVNKVSQFTIKKIIG